MRAVFSLSLFLLITSAYSATLVNDNIDKNIIWQQVNSPYIVKTSIRVAESASLFIEQGTQVRFDQGCELIIQGTFIAKGRPASPIVFTSLAAIPNENNWGGIYFTDFSDDKRCTLKNCLIEKAQIGVRCKDSSPAIKDCIIRKNFQYGVRCEDASPVVIHNIIVENGQPDNGAGISLYGPNTSPILSYNVISHNQNAGIHARFQTKPVVKFNTIVNNTGYGIYCTNQNLWESVTNCNIYGNKQYDCYNKQMPDLDARSNYWGYDTTRELIAGGAEANIKMLFDGNDREPWGRIIYDNWLTQYVDIEGQYKRENLTSEEEDEPPKKQLEKKPPKDSRGYIVHIYSAKNTVIIDYGKPDKVGKNLTFEVLRDGVAIGQIRVTKPGGKTSEASVLNAQTPFQRGDTIALEPTIILSDDSWLSSLRLAENWTAQSLPPAQMRNWELCKVLTMDETRPTRAMKELMRDSEAKVIWNIALAQRGRVYFRKNFEIKSKPSAAILKIAALAPGEIYLNGELVGQLTNLKNVTEFEVDLPARAGGNVIAIASDRGARNAVGLICQLIVYRKPG